MQKPKVIIVGGGLAGCILASHLCESCEVTIIESSKAPEINWTGLKKRPGPSLDSGLGGTTKVWHNALTEIDTRCLSHNWIDDQKLNFYLARAYSVFGLDKALEDELYRRRVEIICNKIPMQACSLGPQLYVPLKRRNTRDFLDLKKIEIIHDKALGYVFKDKVFSAVKTKKNGKIHADIAVDCSGGLGVFNTIRKEALNTPFQSMKYEEHLTGFLGVIKFKKFSLGKLFSTRCINKQWIGRIPISIKLSNGTWAGIFLRPAYFSPNKREYDAAKKEQINSKYFSFLRAIVSPSQFLRALYTRLGILLPTKNYLIYAVFQNPPNFPVFSVSGEVVRCEIPNYDLDIMVKDAFERCQDLLIEHLECSYFDEEAASYLISGAHFSGSVPIGTGPLTVNKNLELDGYSKLFVCSGAVLPETAYGNTGLTIAALAVKLANFLKGNFAND